jgi:diacylglycerol kinase
MVSDISPWRQRNILNKMRHCSDGFRCASKEPGFKYVAALDISISLIGQFGGNPIQCFAASGVALCFELVNSAIESTVDRTGYAFSTLARDAKDLSSAASMLAHIIAIVSLFASMI